MWENGNKHNGYLVMFCKIVCYNNGKEVNSSLIFEKIENYFTYIDVLKRERRNTLRIDIMKKS